MEILLIIFGLLYLKGMNVGMALAITSIVYGFLVVIIKILKTIVGGKDGAD